jgi:heptosyltransferase-3
MNLKNKRIIISKINQMGDVTFTLPLASALKKIEPSCTILFLAREYTRSLVEHYQDIDLFVDWESLNQSPQAAMAGLKTLEADIIIHVYSTKELYVAAKAAKIPLRIGTLSRIHSWLTCNRLVSVRRSKSPLHETQLDMLFLKPLGGQSYYSLEEIIALRHYKPFNQEAACLKLLDSSKFNLILHPKTSGEHIEWAPAKFAELIGLLSPDKFNIFVTGSVREGDQIREIMIKPFPQVIDLCGKISLNELMQLIARADGLLCASTGPVHLAANFGIYTLGLYAPIKPFHAGRWGPVGIKAQTLSIEKNCEACRHAAKCRCINEVSVKAVSDIIHSWTRSS